MEGHSDYLARILRARVYDVATESPLDPAPRLSARIGQRVLLKREDLQPVFSFKLRGAHNRIAALDPATRARGVTCASAGNHAQGVALSARHFGTRAVVVMPVTTPEIKVAAVRALGAEVELAGDTYDDACARALALAAQEGLAFVHPFDDPDVIAGQGTVAMEIFRQHRGPIDAIFVPVGGGGLASGIALYARALYPDVRVVGVEPEESPTMARALAAGAPVTLDHVGIFADGVAVRRAGDETFRICRELLDGIELVGTDEICAAIQDAFEDTRSVLEPAGALALAGLKRHAARGPAGRTLVAVNSGANLNFDRLRHIAERAAVGEQREALLAVEIPEVPGSFLRFCRAIGRRSVTEFNYRYGDARRARIFVGLALRAGAAERAQLLSALAGAGYLVVDLSDDEMAKLHVRHMVGGHAPGLADERLCRFEFPERPGALLDFLQSIGARWNISLFHYRNHGSDFGRVLAGVQVPDADLAEFHGHLARLGYPWWDETANPAYRMFLGAG